MTKVDTVKFELEFSRSGYEEICSDWEEIVDGYKSEGDTPPTLDAYIESCLMIDRRDNRKSKEWLIHKCAETIAGITAIQDEINEWR